MEEDAAYPVDKSEGLQERCVEAAVANTAMAKRHDQLFRRNDEALGRAKRLPDIPARDKADEPSYSRAA